MNKSDRESKTAEQRGFKEMEAESAKREKKGLVREREKGATRRGRRMREGHRRMEHRHFQ